MCDVIELHRYECDVIESHRYECDVIEVHLLLWRPSLLQEVNSKP